MCYACTTCYPTCEDYIVNSPSTQLSYTYQLVDIYPKSNVSFKLEIFNSTARVDYLVSGDGSVEYNDTSNQSDTFMLYHPFGYNQIGELLESTSDRVTGSVFTVNENAIADNFTAYIYSDIGLPLPKSKGMIYRKNDSTLIGTTEERKVFTDMDGEWVNYLFTNPKPRLIKDTEYILTIWGNGSTCLYYDDFAFPRGRFNDTLYDENNGVPPDPIDFTTEDRYYSIYCSYTANNYGPLITTIDAVPDPVGFGMNVTITADVTDVNGVNLVKVNITTPQDPENTTSYTMTNTFGDTYELVFYDTWTTGQYNYTIWAVDNESDGTTSPVCSFDVSVEAILTVCTINDDYFIDQFVNLTDPPIDQQDIGYRFLDNNDVLHIWNKYDNYYFDTNNGVQLTNHYNEYWSHNVLMLGYYNDDVWNLIYRTDNLSGFDNDITCDGETFVNVTLWKDLEYEGYDFRLAIRYHLGVDDNELTVVPYIKNIDTEDIPYVLGFAWEINDIQIDMTPMGDYIEINNTVYNLDEPLDLVFKNMTSSCYYIREDKPGNGSESLYLRWDENLQYKVRVKSRDGQYNAPVTLAIKIGTLDSGEEKYTSLFWHDASEITFYFDGYDQGAGGEKWATFPNKMADGNEDSYASTTIDGDVELLDDNTCAGSDMGMIGKVELRCKGYRSGSGVTLKYDILLRPVFSGGDGDNHDYETGTSGDWSGWFDITSDSNAPGSWGWSDVQGLDCDVEADMVSGYTLYCSSVEVRVAYTVYNPLISDPYPNNGVNGVSISPMLSINVSHPLGETMNVTWLSNSSGSWQVFGTNSSVGNGTFYQMLVNASVNGMWWYWKVNVSVGTVYNESGVFSFYTGYESKISNTGSTNISGYLLLQVQYYDEGEWIIVENISGGGDESPKTVNSGEVLALDTFFNGEVFTTDLIELYRYGDYRVYACFRDPDGEVLVCDDESLMESYYGFTVNSS